MRFSLPHVTRDHSRVVPHKLVCSARLIHCEFGRTHDATPFVVTVIYPVAAPAGTSAVTAVSEFTVIVIAFTLPNFTLVVCFRPVPVILTDAPTGPLSGLKLVKVGSTSKTWGVARSRAGCDRHRSGQRPAGIVAKM